MRTLDLAIVPLPDIPARFTTRKLYDEDFVLVRRAGRGATRRLTLAQYCAAPHLVVSVSGDPTGIVDQELAKRGVSRRVMLTVSNFMQALAIAAETDLVTALPRQFALKHAARHDVAISEPPFPFLSSPLRVVVPAVATRDAGLAWLLDVVESTAKAATKTRRTGVR
jgi:DNA-binding transcriptional LysR family regulator